MGELVRRPLKFMPRDVTFTLYLPWPYMLSRELLSFWGSLYFCFNTTSYHVAVSIGGCGSGILSLFRRSQPCKRLAKAFHPRLTGGLMERKKGTTLKVYPTWIDRMKVNLVRGVWISIHGKKANQSNGSSRLTNSGERQTERYDMSG